MNNCLDIGIIQAFLDGELPLDETSRVSTHIGTCDACSMLLAEAEEESAIVFPALAREMDTLVPTQRLWNKINDSIAVEKNSRPFWSKIAAFLTAYVGSPSVMAAASLILVFGLVTALWVNKNLPTAKAPVPTRASVEIQRATIPVEPKSDEVEPVAHSADVRSSVHVPAVQIERASYRAESHTRSTAPVVTVARAPAPEAYLPGEESYVRTISTLAKTVDPRKDDVLRPSERVAFERDLAVVNDTIAKMKTEVKRNPKNEPAKQILYTSYQNKIDLLNSVAQKEELVASLR